MKAKIIIKGKPGVPVNGKDIYLEVAGEIVEGQISLDIKSPCDEPATATIVFLLPEIEYRAKEE